MAKRTTRDKSMRGITERNGAFRWQIMIEGNRYCGTCHTLSEAIDARNKVKLDRGLSGRPARAKKGPSWTLQQARTFALDKLAPNGWKGAKSYQQNVMQSQLVVRHFGANRRLNDIDLADIEAWAEELLVYGNSTSTVNRKLACLGRMMRLASMYGGLGEVPRFPRRYREPKHRHAELLDDEEIALLRLMRHLGKHDHADAVECLLDLGCRPSELWAVTKIDVDFRQQPRTRDGGDLGHGLVFLYGGSDSGTKTGDVRSVPMTKRVRMIMERRVGHLGDSGFVFPEGCATWLRDVWEQVRMLMGRASDIRFTPYICRRTFITRALRNGIPLETVAKWAGHRNVTTTMRYAYITPSDLIAYVDVIDRANAMRLAEFPQMAPQQHSASLPAQPPDDGKTRPSASPLNFVIL